MLNLKRQWQGLTKRVWRLFCRWLSTVAGCAALFCTLHCMFATAFAYEAQFTDDSKRVRLRWRSEVINLALSNSLRQPAANIKPGSDVIGAIRRSLKTWEAAANIKFVTTWSDKSSISQVDTRGDGISLITIAATAENIAPFHGDSAEMPGRTRTFYDKRGLITESDVVLNPYQQFSTDGSFGTFDLEAVVTHEVGHLLGLDHSNVLAATMYAQQGRNGTFSLPAFAPRTLAEDDRAGVRSLYNAKFEEEPSCCGAASGTLASVNNKQLFGWQVWIEEVTTGKIYAAVTTGNNGFWHFDGLPIGKYRVITQTENMNAEILGTVAIETDKATILNRKISPRSRSFNSLLLGYNGQLSALPLPLGGGRWQTIFLGGENIKVENFRLGNFSSSSTYLQILPESLTQQDFDATFPVASFNLQLSSDVPPGEYNLRVQNSAGEIAYLLGCFTIEQN